MKSLLFPLLIGLLMFASFSCAKTSDTPEASEISDDTSEASAISDEKAEVIEKAVFTDLEGNELTISDFAGKTVLIDVWETWCAPCIASMPTLHQLAEDYPDEFVVVALSPKIMDSPEQVEEFEADHDYNFTYVYGRQFAIDLEIQSIPHKIYIGPDGKYITTIEGSHGPEQDYENTKEIIEANRN